jgi:hypothetical protein
MSLNFFKDSIPYGLITYLLIDGQMPKFSQHQALNLLKKNSSSDTAITQQFTHMADVIDIDAPLPSNLSGFNGDTSQGIGNFIDKILKGGTNFNISGGLNYGYNYQPKGPHAKWH